MYPNGKAAKQRLADELKDALGQGSESKAGSPERPTCIFTGDSKQRLADELREALEQGRERRVLPEGKQEDRKIGDESDKPSRNCRTNKNSE